MAEDGRAGSMSGGGVIDAVFGYGSIVNNESRAGTLAVPVDQALAVPCTLMPSAGYTRAWCFRSLTGFTALGVLPTGSTAAPGGACAGEHFVQHLDRKTSC